MYVLVVIRRMINNNSTWNPQNFSKMPNIPYIYRYKNQMQLLGLRSLWMYHYILQHLSYLLCIQLLLRYCHLGTLLIHLLLPLSCLAELVWCPLQIVLIHLLQFNCIHKHCYFHRFHMINCTYHSSESICIFSSLNVQLIQQVT